MKNIPLPDLYYLENPDLKQLFRIMRISIFLLFFCLFSLMAENSHSQNARVTINRSDAPLESILNEIHYNHQFYSPPIGRLSKSFSDWVPR